MHIIVYIFKVFMEPYFDLSGLSDHKKMTHNKKGG